MYLYKSPRKKINIISFILRQMHFNSKLTISVIENINFKYQCFRYILFRCY